MPNQQKFSPISALFCFFFSRELGNMEINEHVFFMMQQLPQIKLGEKKPDKPKTSLCFFIFFCPIFCGDQSTPCPSKPKLSTINPPPQIFIYSSPQRKMCWDVKDLFFSSSLCAACSPDFQPCTTCLRNLKKGRREERKNKGEEKSALKLNLIYYTKDAEKCIQFRASTTEHCEVAFSSNRGSASSATIIIFLNLPWPFCIMISMFGGLFLKAQTKSKCVIYFTSYIWFVCLFPGPKCVFTPLSVISMNSLTPRPSISTLPSPSPPAI